MGKTDSEKKEKKEKKKEEAMKAEKEIKKEKKAKDVKAAEEPKKEKKEKKEKKAEKEEKEAEKAVDKKAKKEKVEEEKGSGKKEKKKKREEEEVEAPAKKAKADKEEEKKEKKKKKEKAEAEAEPAAKPEEKSAATDGEVNNRVYVGNLPFSMTDDWMKEIMAAAGEIESIDWLTHADSGKFKGSGFITFKSAAAAAAAVKQNGADCEGRPMKVEIATPRKAPVPGGLAGSGDPGVPCESVFVGNLAWSVTEEALIAAFAECGTITRVKWIERDGVFKGNAFLDFDSVEAATKAVALAGTEVAGRPIRINFSKGKSGGGTAEKGAGGGRTERPYKPAGAKPEGCVEIFVGNLPWGVTEEKLAAFFGAAGAKVTSTRWLNDKETGEFKGIGFVGFDDTADVDKAVALGGEQLEGRPIRIDYAGQKKEGAWGGKKW